MSEPGWSGLNPVDAPMTCPLVRGHSGSGLRCFGGLRCGLSDSLKLSDDFKMGMRVLAGLP